jgi:hypothetical protein
VLVSQLINVYLGRQVALDKTVKNDVFLGMMHCIGINGHILNALAHEFRMFRIYVSVIQIQDVPHQFQDSRHTVMILPEFENYGVHIRGLLRLVKGLL